MTGYPFAAIVGQQDTRLALLLAAVNPRVGGVLLRGQKGTAKSTVARGLTALLPSGRLRTLSLGATEDRVAGGLDLEASIARGRPVFSPGLLAEVDGGVLYVDEVNLLDDQLADLVLDAAASGRNVVEREGVGARHPSRFILIGTMNPEEGALRPQLLDRFGLCVEVTGEDDAATRAEIVRRRLAFDADPAGFSGRWAGRESALAGRLARAREAVMATRVPEAAMELAAALAQEAHVAGHRADLVMAEAARAHAAWNGRPVVADEDVLAVAEMVLRHRRREQDPDDRPTRREQPERSGGEPSPEPPPEEGPGESAPAPGAQPGDGSGQSSEDGERSPSSRDGDSPRDGDADPGLDAPRDEPDHDERRNDEQQRDDDVPSIGQAFRVKPIEPGRDRRARSGSGRRMTTRSADHRGRYVGARPTELADDLAIDATLRAAALHQKERHRRARLSGALRPDGAARPVDPGRLTDPVQQRPDPSSLPAVIVEKSDWRRKVRVTRVGSCVVLVVDASGSMGAQGRMMAGKGAVLSLLLDAYVRRDKVALVSFRRRAAQTLVPLTSSVEVAQRGLAELPVGGRTPLSAGLVKAAQLLRPVLVKEPATRPLVVLVTDGRGNVALDGEPSRRATDEAVTVAGRLGADPRITWVVVDTEDPHGIRLSRSADLAQALGAPCLRIEDLRAEDLVGVVSQLDPTPAGLPGPAPARTRRPARIRI